MDSEVQVYDKARWHFEGKWPKGLPRAQAHVHIGWMLGWLIDQKLTSREFNEDFSEDIPQFRKRNLTGPKLIQRSGGTLSSDMVTSAASKFLRTYYTGENVAGICYAEDHEALFKPGLPTSYHAEDSWPNYEKMARKIQQRYDAWKRKPWQLPKPKSKPSPWTCHECGKPITFQVDELTDGVCPACFTLPDAKELKKMERVLAGDRPSRDVLDAIRFYVPADSTPEAALRIMRRFRKWYQPMFRDLQKKGLMEPPLDLAGYWGEIRAADFTAEGRRQFKRYRDGWIKSVKVSRKD